MVRPVIFLLALATPAAAAERYPTVKQIEAGLSKRSDIQRDINGVRLPFQVPVGRAWNVFYLRAKAVGNGEYEVRFRLR